MLSAIEDHEDVHYNRLRDDLKTISGDYINEIKALNYQDYGQGEAAVRSAVEADLYSIKENAFKAWDTLLRQHVLEDHGQNLDGPCYQAERSVTGPKVIELCTIATNASWQPCSECPSPSEPE